MTYYAFIDGIVLALIAVLVVLLIRLWVKERLKRWGRELTQETHSRLQQIELKLDSLLQGLDRLERTSTALTKTVDKLRPGAAEGKTAA